MNPAMEEKEGALEPRTKGVPVTGRLCCPVQRSPLTHNAKFSNTGMPLIGFKFGILYGVNL